MIVAGDEMESKWVEYDRWNEVLAGIIYCETSAFEPVYLDMDDEILAQAGNELGLDPELSPPELALSRAVKQTLLLGASKSGVGVLSLHKERLRTWLHRSRASHADRTDAPPIVALLATFTRAAELMSRDEQYTSRAYFPRLFSLLDIPPDDQGRMESAFRNDSEFLWRSLNDWIESGNGALGQPTAEALGYRYVGLPMSQALIRKADRQALVDLFLDSGLEPELRLSEKDMAAYLKPWLAHGGGTATLRNMWKQPAARRLLLDAAIQILAQWSGETSNDANDATRRPRHPRLTARLIRVGLGKPKLEVGFALRGKVTEREQGQMEWLVESSTQTPKPTVQLEALTDNYLAPSDFDEIHDSSLILGNLRLRLLGSSEDPQFEVVRRPQPIVVLAKLEEVSLFVEVDHAHLCESHMVLANTSIRLANGKPRFDLDAILGQIAQPGFQKIENLDGLPEGWTLYRDVVILARHEFSDIALDALRPVTSSALAISGGLRLPGRQERWSAFLPLTIRGISEEAGDLTVRLVGMDEDEHEGQQGSAEHRWHRQGAEIVVTTEGLNLAGGRYRVSLEPTSQPGEGKSLASQHVYLCAGHSPRRPVVPGVVRHYLSPTSGSVASLPGELSASLLTVQEDADASMIELSWVSGAVTHATQSRDSTSTAIPPPPWWRMGSGQGRTAALAEPAPPDSCAITGRHREQIETHVAGQRDRGVCEGCGRVRMYSARPTPKRRNTELVESSADRTIVTLGSVQEMQPVSPEAFVDSLVWLGGGSGLELTQVIRQIDDSSLGADQIRRSLEYLGFLDTSLRVGDMRSESWAMSPRALAGTVDDKWLMTGAWDLVTVSLVAELVKDAEGHLATRVEHSIPIRTICGLPEAQVQALAGAVGAAFVPSAGPRMLGTLRPLHELLACLPRVSVHGVFDAEWFNVSTASWTRVESIDQPGAYRTHQGLVRRYLYRGEQDVNDKLAVRVTPQIAKHAAAAKRPLVGYNSETESLVVPLGAELPGLYGRAMSLMSGQLPLRAQGDPFLVYPMVSAEAAERLYGLLVERT